MRLIPPDNASDEVVAAIDRANAWMDKHLELEPDQLGAEMEALRSADPQAWMGVTTAMIKSMGGAEPTIIVDPEITEPRLVQNPKPDPDQTDSTPDIETAPF